MKKLAILFLIAVVVFLPFQTTYGGDITLMEKYISNDTVLADYQDKYTDLIESRSEDLEFFENFRINYRNIYYTALNEAKKANGILQVDWNIQNALYDIKAREQSLAITFRNLYSGLYQKKLSVEDQALAVSATSSLYDESVVAHGMGYISDIELLQAEYDYMKSVNSYKSSVRSYEARLRNFNFGTGNDISFTDHVFFFDEDLLEVKSPDEYIDSAVENSKDIILLKQTIQREETEFHYLNKYAISFNYGYFKDKYNQVELDLSIHRLELKAAMSETITDVENKYRDLLAEREKLELHEISYEIAVNDYEVSRSLFNQGLFTKADLQDSENRLIRAGKNLMLAIYDYNTKILELENDCACFVQEDDE